MKISKYLSYREAVHSDTAKRKGLINKPNEEQLQNMKFIATFIFDRVREHIGGALFASSFFRSKELNTAIGGSTTSQHCKGEAIDIDCDRYQHGTNSQVFHYIKDYLEFDQLIWEFGNSINPDWVHVSLKKTNNRKQVLVAYREQGKTKYRPYET